MKSIQKLLLFVAITIFLFFMMFTKNDSNIHIKEHSYSHINETKYEEKSIDDFEKTEILEPIETTKPTESVELEEPTKTEEAVEQDENVIQTINLGQFKLTAYCSCSKCCGKWAINRPRDEYGNEIVYGSTGVRLVAGVSIAVDPRIIPYGSSVIINNHTYVAHDTGGAIKGNRIDVYFNDHQEALNFGVQYANVYMISS